MQRSFRVTEMYAWVVILSVVGLSLVSIFNVIQRRVTLLRRLTAPFSCWSEVVLTPMHGLGAMRKTIHTAMPRNSIDLSRRPGTRRTAIRRLWKPSLEAWP